MSDTNPSARPGSRFTSPAALLGAGVLVASLGAAGGWMVRSSHAPAADSSAQTLALAPNETVVPPAPVPSQPAAQQGQQSQQAPAPVLSPVAPVPAPQHHASAKHHESATSPSSSTAPSTGTATGSGTANATPLETHKAAVCDNCGTIEGVRAIQQKGEGSGVGAVGGAVLGGVLGHQLGGGKGRSALTVLGAVGGGIAGNEIEKRAKSTTIYEVRVRMDDGSLRTFSQKTQPAPGARVVVDGNSFHTVSSHQGSDQGV